MAFHNSFCICIFAPFCSRFEKSDHIGTWFKYDIKLEWFVIPSGKFFDSCVEIVEDTVLCGDKAALELCEWWLSGFIIGGVLAFSDVDLAKLESSLAFEGE